MRIYADLCKMRSVWVQMQARSDLITEVIIREAKTIPSFYNMISFDKSVKKKS